jgi:uncharacterized DUF497 family protein/predicted DNA binding CopG/RHH family protein
MSKEVLNIRKHGVSFLKAVESFSDPSGFQLSDTRHSHVEPRFYWVGKCTSGKVLTTGFTAAESSSGLLARQHGEVLRGSTMKEPSLSDVKIDGAGTKLIRRKMAGPKPIKITINIDGDTLAILRAKSAETGVPYQRLLNRLLTKALQNEQESKSRLDRLEQELARLKRRIVA